MENAHAVKLSRPAAVAVIPASAASYEVAFSLAGVRLAREGDNLVFTFPFGEKIVLASFYGEYAVRASHARFILTGSDLGALAAYSGSETAEPALPKAWTIASFWREKYLPHREKLGRSPMDSTLLKSRFKNHIRAYFGHRKLQDLTEEDFENYLYFLRSQGKLGETTILHCLADLRRLWNYARQMGLVKAPFPGRQAIREVGKALDNEKKCYLEPEEASRLVKVAHERRLNSRLDHDLFCYIVLGLGLGLRAGEIHRLSLQAVERQIIEKTKNRRPRFVHFGFAPVRAMLEERLRLYPPLSPTEPLFRAFGRNAKSPVRQSVPRKYYELIKELGFNETPKRKGHHLEKIDFHALRHTFAALAAMRGVDHLTLMRLMGHKTPAMTLRYIEIADAHQARNQERAMQGIFPEELLKK